MNNDTALHRYQQIQNVRQKVDAQYLAWNGPICSSCNTPYLDHHECDVELIPCPDNKPGCRVSHWKHRS